MLIIPGSLKNENMIRKLPRANYFTPLAPKYSKKRISENILKNPSAKSPNLKFFNQYSNALGKYQESLNSCSLPKLPPLHTVSTKSIKQPLSIIDFSLNTSRVTPTKARQPQALNHMKKIKQKFKKTHFMPLFESRIFFAKKDKILKKFSDKLSTKKLKQLIILPNENVLNISNQSSSTQTEHPIDFQQALCPVPKLRIIQKTYTTLRSIEKYRSVSGKEPQSIPETDFEEIEISGW